jgi:hypothetical protein
VATTSFYKTFNDRSASMASLHVHLQALTCDTTFLQSEMAETLATLFCRKVKFHHIRRELTSITASHKKTNELWQQPVHMQTVIVLPDINRMYGENSHGRTTKRERTRPSNDKINETNNS